jgi:hypothetical protein
MGFLDNSSITVDAILTKKGREILAAGGNLNITKFALSDEEVDYTLYDVTHPNGTDSYGAVIENMSLLEATPSRTGFRSFLVNQSLAGSQLKGLDQTYTSVTHGTSISLTPTTEGGLTEQYTFTIENRNVVVFAAASGQSSGTNTVTATSVDLTTQSINPGATTTVTVTGTQSGLSKVVTISVTADAASSKDPNGPKDVGSQGQYGADAGDSGNYGNAG